MSEATGRYRFNMKILITAALVVGMLVPPTAFPASKPTKRDKKFEADYLKQVNAANAALRDFYNTPCDGLQPVATTLLAQEDKLHELFKAIPDDEDPLVQASQIELAYGVLDLFDKVATKKKALCAGH